MTASVVVSLPLSVDPGDLLEVHVKCGCGRRSTNLRIFARAARKILDANLFEDPEQVGTWWCRSCKQVGILTARSLHFSGYLRRVGW